MVSDNGSQMVGVERELQGMIKGLPYRQAMGILRGKGDEVAVYHASGSSSEQLCGSPSKKLQSVPEDSDWRSSDNPF